MFLPPPERRKNSEEEIPFGILSLPLPAGRILLEESAPGAVPQERARFFGTHFYLISDLSYHGLADRGEKRSVEWPL